MFTGIVEGTGKIINLKGEKVSISASFLKDLKVGDSLSVNGMCLTVEKFEGEIFTFHLSRESLSKSHPSLWKIGNLVNLEKPCTPSTLLGGHIVTGHIDCSGRVRDFQRREILKIEFPEEFSKYIILKGSIAINGVSLTISGINKNIFEVSIIPHTLKNTNLINLKRGNWVHLEFDILSKLLEKLISREGKVK